MASPTWWTWVWVSSGSWWWTGKPSVQSTESQRVRHDWETELSWTELKTWKTKFSPHPVPPIRKLAQASYAHPSEGRENEKHSHRKLTNLITRTTTLPNSMKLWAMSCRATQDSRSWWRVLAKHGLLVNGMANHFSILALRTPWTEWKGNVQTSSFIPQSLSSSGKLLRPYPFQVPEYQHYHLPDRWPCLISPSLTVP